MLVLSSGLKNTSIFQMEILGLSWIENTVFMGLFYGKTPPLLMFFLMKRMTIQRQSLWTFLRFLMQRSLNIGCSRIFLKNLNHLVA
ncbi:hypothetical protein DZC75_07095 [Pseudomonas parafulva]|uniref:Uncharacterized protein n=1 Tax=Pseudomonas parafulva TaxID=157782 RepID=A0AAI8KA70_9PSED|nr:hypothetical protein DZC75_07095 [Pseudomonas parafulva]